MDRQPKRQKVDPASHDEDLKITLQQLVEIRIMYDLLELELAGSQECVDLLKCMEFEYAYTRDDEDRPRKRLQKLTDGMAVEYQYKRGKWSPTAPFALCNFPDWAYRVLSHDYCQHHIVQQWFFEPNNPAIHSMVNGQNTTIQ